MHISKFFVHHIEWPAAQRRGHEGSMGMGHCITCTLTKLGGYMPPIGKWSIVDIYMRESCCETTMVVITWVMTIERHLYGGFHQESLGII